jgi:tellurite resistance protein TehA-like permease
MNWDTTYAIALIPPVGAVVVSLLVVMFGGSADAGQWAAIITFFITLPFVVGRLIDRAK